MENQKLKVKSQNYFRILGAVAVLSLFGLGCKKPGSLYDETPQNPGLLSDKTKTIDPSIFEERPQPQPPGVLSGDQKTELAPEIAYLEQVLHNLSLADSFRAKMTIVSKQDGKTTAASVSFKKSVGLYGSLENTDVFVSAADALFRTNGGDWNDLSESKDGQKLSAMFSSNTLLNQGQVESLLSENARFAASEETSEGCKRYAVEQITSGGERLIKICVKADMPAYIAVEDSGGELKVEYSDINGSVVVYKPKI